MSKAVTMLCVYAGTLERCRLVFGFFFGGTGRGLFFLGGAISLLGVLASRLAWLNCRFSLAGANLLERGCVMSGVRFSSAMRFHGVAFEACVFH